MYIKNNFKDKILYVGQHDFLFIDTILNNLTLGSKEIESRKEDISYLEILYNSRIELVKSKEGIYIKAPEKI